MVFIAQNPDDAKPPVIRKLAGDKGEWFNVSVETTGDSSATYRYRMHLIPVLRNFQPKVPKGYPKPPRPPVSLVRAWQFVMTDLEAKLDDKSVEQGTFGVVPVTLEDSGFLGGLSFKGLPTQYMLPLMSWYLPPAGSQPEKTFDIDPLLMDEVLRVSGSGRYRRAENARVPISIDLDFQVEGKDFIPKRHLELRVVLDSETGSLVSSEGNYKAPDGTLHFKIQRS